MEFHVEDHPDPLDIEFLEVQIRREASAAMGLGDEVDLAIFVRDAGTVVAGISGWTWGDCCELQNLWVDPNLRGRASRPGSSPPPKPRPRPGGAHRPSTSPTTSRPEHSMNRSGYRLVGRVEDFPSGTDVLWFHKSLQPDGGVSEPWHQVPRVMKSRAGHHLWVEPGRISYASVRGLRRNLVTSTVHQ